MSRKTEVNYGKEVREVHKNLENAEIDILAYISAINTNLADPKAAVNGRKRKNLLKQESKPDVPNALQSSPSFEGKRLTRESSSSNKINEIYRQHLDEISSNSDSSTDSNVLTEDSDDRQSLPDKNLSESVLESREIPNVGDDISVEDNNSQQNFSTYTENPIKFNNIPKKKGGNGYIEEDSVLGFSEQESFQDNKVNRTINRNRVPKKKFQFNDNSDDSEEDKESSQISVKPMQSVPTLYLPLNNEASDKPLTPRTPKADAMKQTTPRGFEISNKPSPRLSLSLKSLAPLSNSKPSTSRSDISLRPLTPRKDGSKASTPRKGSLTPVSSVIAHQLLDDYGLEEITISEGDVIKSGDRIKKALSEQLEQVTTPTAPASSEEIKIEDSTSSVFLQIEEPKKLSSRVPIKKEPTIGIDADLLKNGEALGHDGTQQIALVDLQGKMANPTQRTQRRTLRPTTDDEESTDLLVEEDLEQKQIGSLGFSEQGMKRELQLKHQANGIEINLGDEEILGEENVEENIPLALKDSPVKQIKKIDKRSSHQIPILSDAPFGESEQGGFTQIQVEQRPISSVRSPGKSFASAIDDSDEDNYNPVLKESNEKSSEEIKNSDEKQKSPKKSQLGSARSTTNEARIKEEVSSKHTNKKLDAEQEKSNEASSPVEEKKEPTKGKILRSTPFPVKYRKSASSESIGSDITISPPIGRKTKTKALSERKLIRSHSKEKIKSNDKKSPRRNNNSPSHQKNNSNEIDTSLMESVFVDEKLKEGMERRWEEFLVAARFGAEDLVVDVGEELSMNLFQSIDVAREFIDTVEEGKRKAVFNNLEQLEKLLQLAMETSSKATTGLLSNETSGYNELESTINKIIKTIDSTFHIVSSTPSLPIQENEINQKTETNQISEEEKEFDHYTNTLDTNVSNELALISQEQYRAILNIDKAIEIGDQEKMQEALESVALSHRDLIRVARDTIVDIEEFQAKKIERVIEDLEKALPEQAVLAKELFKNKNNKTIHFQMNEAKSTLRQKYLSLNAIIVKQRKSRQYTEKRRSRLFEETDDRLKAIELKKLEIRLVKETSNEKRAELSKEILRIVDEIKREKKSILEKKERDTQVTKIERRRALLKIAQSKAQQAKVIAHKRKQEQIALEKEQLREKIDAKFKKVEQRREEIRKRIKEMRAIAMKKFASRPPTLTQWKGNIKVFGAFNTAQRGEMRKNPQDDLIRQPTREFKQVQKVEPTPPKTPPKKLEPLKVNKTLQQNSSTIRLPELKTKKAKSSSELIKKNPMI